MAASIRGLTLSIWPVVKAVGDAAQAKEPQASRGAAGIGPSAARPKEASAGVPSDEARTCETSDDSPAPLQRVRGMEPLDPLRGCAR